MRSSEGAVIKGNLCLSEDNKIDEKELSEFYMNFIGIPEDNVKSLVRYAMDQMTDVSLQSSLVYLLENT